jgi:hypothetical protein
MIKPLFQRKAEIRITGVGQPRCDHNDNQGHDTDVESMRYFIH